MHVHFLDPHRSLNSPVHSLDGRVKFILTVAFILTASLTPFAAWPVYILLLATVMSVEILSRVGVGYVQRRASLALPFVLAALPLVFSIEGANLFSVRLGSWTLTASLEGLERFVSVGLKSWLSIQAAIVLTSSTSLPDLLQAMRAVR
ncbi:MAG: energy-coupling factor transporter transmembrane component T, partial [Chloroflexi bacterium]|nr:energy-coupling factor transporter transmembrane component T [Chloroflexota bacterium]